MGAREQHEADRKRRAEYRHAYRDLRVAEAEEMRRMDERANATAIAGFHGFATASTLAWQLACGESEALSILGRAMLEQRDAQRGAADKNTTQRETA